MKKRILPRLRDPCAKCLVITICGVRCEIKEGYEKRKQLMGDWWDMVKLTGSFACLICMLPFVAFAFMLTNLLYRVKIGNP